MGEEKAPVRGQTDAKSTMLPQPRSVDDSPMEDALAALVMRVTEVMERSVPALLEVRTVRFVTPEFQPLATADGMLGGYSVALEVGTLREEHRFRFVANGLEVFAKDLVPMAGSPEVLLDWCATVTNPIMRQANVAGRSLVRRPTAEGPTRRDLQEMAIIAAKPRALRWWHRVATWLARLG